MSNHSKNPLSGSDGRDGYEHEDFSTGAIVGSLIGLAVMCVVSFFIVVGMYRYLESTQMEHAPANPMVPMKADTRHMTPGKNPNDLPMEVMAFPTPRLQEDDVQDMRQQLFGEEARLQSYGWVDKDSGEARIPIDRAMELLAARGLPVRGTAAAAPSVPSEPVGKSAKAAPSKKKK
jgi:hypothetical protein